MERPEILIIGINSFLGNALYKLTKDKFLVTGVYHQQQENIPVEIKKVQVNSLPQLKDIDFKHIYLVSSYIPVDNKPNEDQMLFDANILLPSTISNLFPKARIIFFSSVSVYENRLDINPISIIEKPTPKSKYALSKLWGENIIEKHNSNAIIRVSSMYGTGMKRITFIPKIIENVIKNNKISLSGDGSRMQNYIHVGDVAKIAFKAAQRSENLLLLAVSEQSYSNSEIAEMILEVVPGELEFIGEDYSKSSVYDYPTNQEILGKIEFKMIRTGLKELIEWIRNAY